MRILHVYDMMVVNGNGFTTLKLFSYHNCIGNLKLWYLRSQTLNACKHTQYDWTKSLNVRVNSGP